MLLIESSCSLNSPLNLQEEKRMEMESKDSFLRWIMAINYASLWFLVGMIALGLSALVLEWSRNGLLIAVMIIIAPLVAIFIWGIARAWKGLD